MNALRSWLGLSFLVSLACPAQAALFYRRHRVVPYRAPVYHAAPVVINPTPVTIVQVNPAALAAARKEHDAIAAALARAANQRNERALVGVDERVAEFLRQQTEDGSIYAPLELAQRYESGRGVPTDPAEACRLYGIAAERGSKEAKHWLRDNPTPSSDPVQR